MKKKSVKESKRQVHKNEEELLSDHIYRMHMENLKALIYIVIKFVPVATEKRPKKWHNLLILCWSCQGRGSRGYGTIN